MLNLSDRIFVRTAPHISDSQKLILSQLSLNEEV